MLYPSISLPVYTCVHTHTRLRLRTRMRFGAVFGALLGVQTGRKVEVFNSFELIFNPGATPEAPMVMDPVYLKDKAEQRTLHRVAFSGFAVLRSHFHRLCAVPSFALSLSFFIRTL